MSLRPRHRSNSGSRLSVHSQIEEWWEGGSSTGSIAEEATGSEYYMDLGAESPMPGTPNPLLKDKAFVEQWAAAGIAVPRVPARRSSWRSLSSIDKERERLKTSKKDTVDRDCGICFEYAVRPCRTLCCGKIFCTEHLADWLHGPNAEGRCPNCENPCSLEGGTLSLVTPSLKTPESSQARPSASQPGSDPPSSSHSTSQPVQSCAQPSSRDQASFPGSSALRHSKPTSSVPVLATPDQASSSSTSSPTISTAGSLDVINSSDEEPRPDPHSTASLKASLQLGINGAGNSLSTTPFSTSWGAISRFMSIVTFLMFLYKLLS
ncbi:hypothetical protein CVT26_009878 [Gymnopilus dilepis]|uniref:RING-type domain-containing protein n=1 Tax=Gymnopilus dilepis TaxID=231916 RepID=A0A409YC10_9AGAR|nr:hypothetical protein CVT26_009878 [Gymnopilus dilepis]